MTTPTPDEISAIARLEVSIYELEAMAKTNGRDADWLEVLSNLKQDRDELLEQFNKP